MAVVFFRTARHLPPSTQAFAFLLGAALIVYFAQNFFLFDTPSTVPHFYVLLGFVIFLEGMILTRSGSGAVEVSVPVKVASDRRPLFSTLSRDSALASVALVVAIGTIAVVFLLNGRPLAASSQGVDALNDGLGWEQRFEAFEDSVGAFPSQSNYLRTSMFTAFATQWVTMSDSQMRDAVQLVSKHGPAGRDMEPDEWRLLNAMTAAYQRAGNIDGQNLARARELVETAVGLAPSRIEVRLLLIVQSLAEGDNQEALRLMDSYIAEAPETAHHHEGLREQVANEIERRESGQ